MRDMIAKFEAVIENYKGQYQQLAQQLNELERAYAEQKAQLVQSIHQVAGAISAVEALLNDEKGTLAELQENAETVLAEPEVVAEDTNG
jgi:ABC-type transporter Mla subunit MlaD